MEKIYVITKRPGCPARHVWMSNSLAAFQKAVGGYIEAVTLAPDAALICNEEGRLLGLERNCKICGVDFCGPIVLVGVHKDAFADWPFSWDETRKLFPALFREEGSDG